MADITVTFGGREVVLTMSHAGFPAYFGGGLRLFRGYNRRGSDYGWFATCGDHRTDAAFDSPQAAVSSLESKLRQLRSELDGVLGDRAAREVT